MNRDIQIKEETNEYKHHPRIFHCDTCDIRFSNRDTLNAHRQHYCTEQERTSSHATEKKCRDLIDSHNQSTSISLLSNRDITFSQVDQPIQHQIHHSPQTTKKAFAFDRPIQIGKFIYVPIPMLSSDQDSSPLDLSKPKEINSPMASSREKGEEIIPPLRLYQCHYCSIDFRSLKTLHAHQDGYCIEYRKQTTTRKKNNHHHLSVDDNRSLPIDLFVCRLCKYRHTTLRGMRVHLKYHLANNQSCSENDIIRKSKLFSLQPQRKSLEALLQCTICSAMFDAEETLFNHMKCVHTNRRFLQCLECQSRFCSKWNLIRHMKFAHTNVKSNSLNLTSTDTYCSACEISFLKKTSYDAHQRFYCRNIRDAQHPDLPE